MFFLKLRVLFAISIIYIENCSFMNVKLALFKNLLSGSLSKISTIGIRLLQVPILLSALGAEEYGRWLIISSLPSWLVLANLGFGSVAGNEISMAIGAGDNNGAVKVYSTTIALISILAFICSILVIIIAPIIPWANIMSILPYRQGEIVYSIVLLSLSIFISFLAEAFGVRFRAAHKNHVGVLLSSIRPWVELLFLMIFMKFNKGFQFISLSIFLSTIFYLLLIWWFSRKLIRELSFSIQNVDKTIIKNIFKKGVAFQAFPLGNAMLFQGNLLVIQSFLGPIAVAAFATARTLVRSINQIFELINQVIWPELSHLIGAKKYEKASQIHRLGVISAIVVSFTLVIILSLIGVPIYTLWTGKEISLSQNLLVLFLIPIPFNALWFTSSVVHAATNQHESLAKRYLLGSIISVICCYFFSKFFGLGGAAVSTIVLDILLIPFVLKHSLTILNESWETFITEIFNDIKKMKDLNIIDYVKKITINLVI